MNNYCYTKEVFYPSLKAQEELRRRKLLFSGRLVFPSYRFFVDFSDIKLQVTFATCLQHILSSVDTTNDISALIARVALKLAHSAYCSGTDFLKRNALKVTLFVVALFILTVSLFQVESELLRHQFHLSVGDGRAESSESYRHHPLVLQKRLLTNRKVRLGLSSSC